MTGFTCAIPRKQPAIDCRWPRRRRRPTHGETAAILPLEVFGITPKLRDNPAYALTTEDIRPIFERSCVGCHSGEKPKGGYPLIARDLALKGGQSGEAAVVPGKPDASPLIRFVQDQVEDLEMPPVVKRGKFPALTKDEIAKLNGWIAQGANWPDGAKLHAPGK